MTATAMRYGVLLVGVLLVGACATTSPRQGPTAQVEPWPALPADSALADLAGRLDGARHVHVGETHADVRSQAAQLAVLEALRRARRRLVVGVEWLSPASDAALAAWTSGDLAEADLADALGWKEAWGYPLDTYLPILRWARDHGVRVVGINAPVGLARRFGRVGPDGMTPTERSQLPALDTANETHRRWFCERINAVMAAHGGHGHASPEPEPEAAPEAAGSAGAADDPCTTVPPRYYEAQLIRDEAMAIGISAHLSDPTVTAVVLAGTGHVIHGLGVPKRVEAATGLPGRVVLQPDDSEPDAAAEEAEQVRRYGPAADVWWPPRASP